MKNLTNLRNVTVHLLPGDVKLDAIGDDMHPICVLRGINLQTRASHLKAPRARKGQLNEKIIAFQARMMAHVARPRSIGTGSGKTLTVTKGRKSKERWCWACRSHLWDRKWY